MRRTVVRESRNVFHVAVPAYDLDEALAFYVTGLGCQLARRYPDRVTLDFFGDQLVRHLAERSETLVALEQLDMYPRHFGVTFRDRADFDALLELCRQRGLTFFADVGRRFEGLTEVHRMFVLCDPSDNLIEFKHYDDPEMMY